MLAGTAGPSRAVLSAYAYCAVEEYDGPMCPRQVADRDPGVAHVPVGVSRGLSRHPLGRQGSARTGAWRGRKGATVTAVADLTIPPVCMYNAAREGGSEPMDVQRANGWGGTS